MFESTESTSPMEMSPIFRPFQRPFVSNRTNHCVPDATINTRTGKEEETNSTDSQETYFSQADLFSSYQDEPTQDTNDVANCDPNLFDRSIHESSQQTHFNNIIKKSSSHDIIFELEREIQSLIDFVVIENCDIKQREEIVAKIESAMSRIEILSFNVSRSEKKRLESMITSCEVLQQQLSSVSKIYDKMPPPSQPEKVTSRSTCRENVRVQGHEEVDLPDLKTLMDVKSIYGGRTCLILRTTGCSQTYGYLNKDGSIVDKADSLVYKDVETWLGSKREGPVTRKEAYSHTFYRHRSLSSICAKFLNSSQKSRHHAILHDPNENRAKLLPKEQCNPPIIVSLTTNQQSKEIEAESLNLCQISDSQIQEMIKFSQPDTLQTNSSNVNANADTNESLDIISQSTPSELQFNQRHTDWVTIEKRQNDIAKIWERIISDKKYRKSILKFKSI